MSSWKSSFALRANELPPADMRVSLVVMLTKFKPSEGQKSPTRLTVLPFESRMIPKELPKEKKNKDGSAKEEAPKLSAEDLAILATAGNEPVPIKAFARDYFVSMFGCNESILVIGGLFLLNGVTYTHYLDKKSKAICHSFGVAQIIEASQVDLANLLADVPFADRRVQLENDLYDPECADGYDTTYDANHGVCVEVKPASTLPKTMDGEWFPNQPQGTVYARLPPVDCLEFTIQPDDKKPIFHDTLGGPKKTPVQFWVHQRDVDGEDAKLIIKTRIYREVLMFWMARKWELTAPLLMPHAAGWLIGTVNNKETTIHSMCDTSVVRGAIFMYSQLYPNLATTLEAASSVTSDYQTAWRVKSALAKRLVTEFHREAGVTVVPPAPKLPVKWMNGVNLMLRAVPEYFDDETFDYYFLSNYNFTQFRKFKKLTEMTEDQLFEEFTNMENYDATKERVIEVYATVRGGQHSVENAMKNAIIMKKKRVLQQQQTNEQKPATVDHKTVAKDEPINGDKPLIKKQPKQ